VRWKLQCRSSGKLGAIQSACTSGIPEPSHALHAIRLSGEEAEESLRVSFGRYPDEHRVSDIVDVLIDALTQCRNL